MNMETHQRYFETIDVNKDGSFEWQQPSFLEAHKDIVDVRMKEKVRQCTQLDSLDTLLTSKGELICIWISTPLSQSFESISKAFHLWHEFKRGEYKGIHEFAFGSSWIILLNTLYVEDNMNDLRKANIISPTSFRSFSNPYLTNTHDTGNKHTTSIHSLSTEEKKRILIVSSAGTSVDCTTLCEQQQRRCDPSLFTIINTCSIMQKHFPCTSCEVNYGPEQPAYVTTASQNEYAGRCLVSSSPTDTTCGASHKDTQRLCACI